MKKYLLTFAAALVIAVCGFLAGTASGRLFLSSFLSGGSLVPMLISSPAMEFSEVYRLVNSSNPLDRISGYYALSENKIIDLNFLHERYREENTSAIRLIIVQAMGKSDELERVYSIYDREFDAADITVKMEILRNLKRMNYRLYDFSSKHDVSGFKLEGPAVYQ